MSEKARELAREIGAAHDWHSKPCEACEANIVKIAEALAACALEARQDEAVDWRDAAVSLTRSAHEKWMEARIAELRLERAAGQKEAKSQV
jgi:hypothetical protein